MKNNADSLYTKFCIGVELGDEALVQQLILRGADTMVSYSVDGVLRTPMRSALTRADIPMTMALLSSRATKVRLTDLEDAPKMKREQITPVLLQRLSMALEDGARENLLQRPVVNTPSRRTVKISLPEALSSHLRDNPTLVQASKYDRPRCPPGDSALSESDSAEEDEENEEVSSDDEKASTTGSIDSSAGETTDQD